MFKIILMLYLCLLASCSSMIQEGMRSTPISKIGETAIEINSYKYVGFTSTKTEYAYNYGMTSPKEIQDIMKKALSWNEQSKNKKIEFNKELDSFAAGGVVFNYYNTETSENSYVRICYRNQKYQALDVRECDSANLSQIKKIIEDLSESNIESKLNYLTTQKNALNELK